MMLIITIKFSDYLTAYHLKNLLKLFHEGDEDLLSDIHSNAPKMT